MAACASLWPDLQYIAKKGFRHDRASLQSWIERQHGRTCLLESCLHECTGPRAQVEFLRLQKCAQRVSSLARSIQLWKAYCVGALLANILLVTKARLPRPPLLEKPTHSLRWGCVVPACILSLFADRLYSFAVAAKYRTASNVTGRSRKQRASGSFTES